MAPTISNDLALECALCNRPCRTGAVCAVRCCSARRLSEILGAVHYLRELCGANDGQAWRDRMKELMDAEGSTALRRAKLTRSFNNGYRSYSRTYNSCTPSAQTAISRFLTEGAEIADALTKSVP